MLLDQLETIKTELPGCIATSIVSIDDGLALASVANDAIAAAGADAFHANLYTLVNNLVLDAALDDRTETIVIESEHLTFVSAPIGNTRYFWHVVTNRKTTLGFTHAVMRKYGPGISESVVSLVG